MFCKKPFSRKRIKKKSLVNSLRKELKKKKGKEEKFSKKKKKSFVNIFKRAKFSKNLLWRKRIQEEKYFAKKKIFKEKNVKKKKIFCEYFLFLELNFQKKWRKVFKKQIYCK